jgi:hypothetical protein
MKNIFYIIYNYDNKELPYMLCNDLEEVSNALGYKKRMVQYGLNKGLVFTRDDGKRFTVNKFNYKELDKEGTI